MKGVGKGGAPGDVGAAFNFNHIDNIIEQSRNRTLAAADISDMAEDQFAAIKQENRAVYQRILEAEAQRNSFGEQAEQRAAAKGRGKESSMSRRGRSPTNQDVAKSKKKTAPKLAFGCCAQTPRECMLNLEPMGYYQHPDRYVNTASSPKRKRDRSAPKARPPGEHGNHSSRLTRSNSPIVRKIPAPLAPYLSPTPDPNIMYRNIPTVNKPKWQNTMKVSPPNGVDDIADLLLSMGVKNDGTSPEPPVRVLRSGHSFDQSFSAGHTTIPTEVWSDICRRLEFLELQSTGSFEGFGFVEGRGLTPEPIPRGGAFYTAPQLDDPLNERNNNREESTERPRQEHSEKSSIPQVAVPSANPPYVAQFANAPQIMTLEGGPHPGMQLYSAPAVPQQQYIASAAPQISTVANGDMSAFIPNQTINPNQILGPVPNPAPQITTVVSGVPGVSDMVIQQSPERNFEEPTAQGPQIMTVEGNGMVVMPPLEWEQQQQQQFSEVQVQDAPQIVTQANGSIDVQQAPQQQPIQNFNGAPQIVTNAEGHIMMAAPPHHHHHHHHHQQEQIQGAPQIQTVAGGEMMVNMNYAMPPQFIHNANAPQIQTVQNGGMVLVQQPAHITGNQDAPQIVTQVDGGMQLYSVPYQPPQTMTMVNDPNSGPQIKTVAQQHVPLNQQTGMLRSPDQQHQQPLPTFGKPENMSLAQRLAMEEEEAENMHGQQQSSLAAQMAAEEAEAEAMFLQQHNDADAAAQRVQQAVQGMQPY